MTGSTTIPAPLPDAVGRLPLQRGFADRQSDFARAILDPNKPVPSGLVGPDGRPSAKRFAVYRNNVVVGLIETLKAAYPVVHRLVGEAFFVAMAREYVMIEPPSSPIMLHYGAGFPAFIGGFEPAAALSYLGDVARLERAWAEAYHAAEAPPLDASALTGVPPGELPHLMLTFHPSMRVVRSVFPIVSIWQANVENADGALIDLDDGGEDAIVARPKAEVEVRRLPVGAAAFMEALQEGLPVIEALKEGLSSSPRFDLAGTLRGMAEAGVIVGGHIQPLRSMEIA